MRLYYESNKITNLAELEEAAKKMGLELTEADNVPCVLDIEGTTYAVAAAGLHQAVPNNNYETAINMILFLIGADNDVARVLAAYDPLNEQYGERFQSSEV
jgi:ABC-type uncharacterized transport system substrate-binding protein